MTALRIAHLADIQIRAHSRHEEYAKSFQNLYDSLNVQNVDRIVIAGDILHHKTTLSPEAVDLCAQLFRRLSEIAPLDIILGNHDLAMNNLSRMDAITPIVNALENVGEINFMRESFLTSVGKDEGGTEYNYCTMSCIDDAAVWETVRQTALEYSSCVNIGLWHGTVSGVELDNGSIMETPHGLDMFKGLDYVMLGDIHKTQVLDKERRIAYPGSYPKQSYGEAETGGYFLWDIKNKKRHTLEFIELPTINPFYTVDVSEVFTRELQKRCRVRVKCNGLDALEQRKLAEQVRKAHDAIEVRIIDETPVAAKVADAIEIEDLRSAPVQDDLLLQWASDKALSPGQKKELLLLNQKANDALPTDDVLRNVRYQIKSMEFSNLFSFGENNVLDFTKLKGVIGVTGANRSGKSSMAVDAPLYAMYNKISKPVQRNQDYVRQGQSKACCAVNIQVAGSEYRIERETTVKDVKKRNGATERKSATTVQFSRDGKSLNALERGDTDKEIRKVFGTSEDFLKTSVAAQFDLLGFVNDKASERKKTIGRYFDLDVFEQKHAFAKDEHNALKRDVQRISAKDYDAEINEASQNLAHLNADAKDAEAQARKASEAYERACEQYGALQALQRQPPPQDTALKREAHNLKAQYTESQRRIQRLERNIADMKAYKCVSNADCCMRQRLEVLNDEMALERNESQRHYDAVHDLVARQKQAQEAQAAPAQDNALDEARKTRDGHSRALAAHRQQIASLALQHANAQSRVKRLTQERSDAAALKDRYLVSQVFCDAMSKDGISLQIIKRNLALLNASIARLLGDTTNFKVWLENEDKDITVYFQECNGSARQIELCSGMEKTLASIAIRVALISVTSLPVSNVFILDEAFTALDVDHLEAMGAILSNLKSQFDTILVICHDQHIADLYDDVITVRRDEQNIARAEHAHG